MRQEVIIGLLILLIVLMVLMIVYVSYLEKRVKKQSIYRVKKRKKRVFIFQAYRLFSRFFLTKRYIQRVRSKIEMQELSDNLTITYKTMHFAGISTGCSLLLFISLVIMNTKGYYLVIGGFTIYMIHNQILNLLIGRTEHKLFTQFVKFLEDVRHHYHEHGMIDEAIYDAVEQSAYEISLHAAKMYEVLSSEDSENALAEYYDLVPNKFFKVFLALCFTVQKYGDQLVDGKSMFLSNLNYLKQEIHMELLRRKKINHLFKSLSIIAVLPVFFLPWIEVWAKKNLPEMVSYYDGAYGFMVQTLLFLVSGLACELVFRMQSNAEERPMTLTKPEAFFMQVSFIKKAMRNVHQKKYTKMMKLQQLLKMVGANMNAEHFTLRRFLIGAVGVVLALAVALNAHTITKRNTLEQRGSLFTQQNDVDTRAKDAMIQSDKQYLLFFAGKDADVKVIQHQLFSDGAYVGQAACEVAAKRISGLLERYENQYFKWWELLLALGAGYIFYLAPYLILQFRKKVLQMNMEDEVMQFHTIILMLMYIERMSVEELLEWMSMFAVLFRNGIIKCLNNFEHGDIEALEELKMEEPFVPFARIIENLQAAADRLPIRQVFDELRIERGYYQEKRKQDNEEIVEKKGLWGKLIAFTPMALTLSLYLIVPFVHLSVIQYMQYNNQIKIYM